MAGFSLFGGNTDVLETKKRELMACATQYSSAVELVSNTVAGLRSLSSEIADKIKEIDTYQKELFETRDEMMRMKDKSDKVAANFSALLGE